MQFEIISSENNSFTVIPTKEFESREQAIEFIDMLNVAITQKEWFDREQSDVDSRDYSQIDMRPQFSLDADTTEELEKLSKLKNMQNLDVVKMIIQNEIEDHVEGDLEC